MEKDNDMGKELELMGELENEINKFYQSKIELDNYKAITDQSNKLIKDLMAELDIKEYSTDEGNIAKLIIQNRESFNEIALIDRLKELGITKPIKTVEVIDYEVLEDVIYNNELDATKLTDCKQSKEVITLKVSKRKV